jgi:hypothetical protein
MWGGGRVHLPPHTHAYNHALTRARVRTYALAHTRRQAGETVVDAIQPGSAAAAAGRILLGDRLVSVDRALVDTLPFEEVCDRIRGRAGATVSLELRSPPAGRQAASDGDGLRYFVEVERRPQVQPAALAALALAAGRGGSYVAALSPRSVGARSADGGVRTSPPFLAGAGAGAGGLPQQLSPAHWIV